MDGPQGILPGEKHNTTPFGLTADSAPSFYFTGHPTEQQVRQFERETGMATAPNPITGRVELLRHRLASSAERRLLHMITADPQKTPTFIMFGKPDSWMNYYSCDTSANPTQPGCVHVEGPTGDAWNHGTDVRQVVRTWLGMAGPRVKVGNVDDHTWFDHADIHPTMMSLLGLGDDYLADGRVITQALSKGSWDPSETARLHRFSTTAMLSGSASNDSAQVNAQRRLVTLADERDDVVGRIRAVLNGVELSGHQLRRAQADVLIDHALMLLARAHELASQRHDGTR